MTDKPVIVELHVEGFGGSADDTIEIPRDEWDAMTPAERSKLIDDEAEAFGTNYVNWGWNISDPDDLTAANPY